MSALFNPMNVGPMGLAAKLMARDKDKQRVEPAPAGETPQPSARRKNRIRIGAGALSYAARDLLAKP